MLHLGQSSGFIPQKPTGAMSTVISPFLLRTTLLAETREGGRLVPIWSYNALSPSPVCTLVLFLTNSPKISSTMESVWILDPSRRTPPSGYAFCKETSTVAMLIAYRTHRLLPLTVVRSTLSVNTEKVGLPPVRLRAMTKNSRTVLPAAVR